MNTLSDGRHRGWYHIDNAILDEYGPLVGAIGIAVYNVLVRRARETGHGRVSWPSYAAIAEALSISRPTAIATVRTLIAYGLVRSETVKEAGKRTANHYTIATIQAPNTGKGDLPVNDVDQSAGKSPLPVNVVYQSAGKGDLPVKHVDQSSARDTGKGDLLVNDVYHAGKGDLPVLVNEVDPNNTQLQDTGNKTNSTQRAHPSAARGARIPAVWPAADELPDMLAFARELEIDEGTARREIAEYHDYWQQATKNATSLDWVKRWRSRFAERVREGRIVPARLAPGTPRPDDPPPVSGWAALDPADRAWESATGYVTRERQIARGMSLPLPSLDEETVAALEPFGGLPALRDGSIPKKEFIAVYRHNAGHSAGSEAADG